jgi:hypothetical protein
LARRPSNGPIILIRSRDFPAVAAINHFPFAFSPISTSWRMVRAFASCFGPIQVGIGPARHFVLDFRASPARLPDQQAECAENNQDAACNYEPMPKP